MDFRAVWNRVAELEGELFRTARGDEFRYRFKKTFVVTDPAGQSIPRTNFEKIHRRRNGAEIPGAVQGQAFIEAVYDAPRFIS